MRCRAGLRWEGAVSSDDACSCAAAWWNAAHRQLVWPVGISATSARPGPAQINRHLPVGLHGVGWESDVAMGHVRGIAVCCFSKAQADVNKRRERVGRVPFFEPLPFTRLGINAPEFEAEHGDVLG